MRENRAISGAFRRRDSSWVASSKCIGDDQLLHHRLRHCDHVRRRPINARAAGGLRHTVVCVKPFNNKTTWAPVTQDCQLHCRTSRDLYLPSKKSQNQRVLEVTRVACAKYRQLNNPIRSIQCMYLLNRNQRCLIHVEAPKFAGTFPIFCEKLATVGAGCLGSRNINKWNWKHFITHTLFVPRHTTNMTILCPCPLK